jgi:hypothetical protein
MWWLWLGCAPAPDVPLAWPQAADAGTAVHLDGARRYLDAVAASTGDPPERATAALGHAGTTATEPASRALLSAWLLDAEVRRCTGDTRRLRDAVAIAPEPVTLEAWHAAAEAVAGEPLPTWIAQDAGTGPLDYGAALHWFGVAWRDDPDGTRHLVADPGAQPQARARRQRW